MLRFTLIKYIDKLLYNDEKIFPVLFEHYILKVHPMLYRYRLFHRMTDNASEDELGCYVNKNVFFPEQTQILSHLFKWSWVNQIIFPPTVTERAPLKHDGATTR